jgi:hypothetical protein
VSAEQFAWEFIAKFGAVLWSFITGVLVPIAAAGVAAAVVVWQIRRSNADREDARRGNGVRAGCELFLTTQELAVRNDATSVDKVATNRRLVDMHTFLTGNDRSVGRWVGRVNGELIGRLELWERTVLEQGQIDLDAAVTSIKTIGPIRAGIAREAAECVERLLAWHRGDLPTQWFVDNLPDHPDLVDARPAV